MNRTINEWLTPQEHLVLLAERKCVEDELAKAKREELRIKRNQEADQNKKHFEAALEAVKNNYHHL